MFPKLKIISFWADGSAGQDAAELNKLFPTVYMQPKGLLATEYFASFPLVGEDGGRLCVNSHFFEFRRADGKIYTADRLERGEYELIVTTGGGLYRYMTGDVIEVLETYPAESPRIRFLRRSGVTSDLCGEKLTDDFVRSACEKLGIAGSFCLLAPEGKGYVLYTSDRSVTDEIFDRALRESYHYNYCRELLNKKRYITINTVEAIRGCCHRCSFCAYPAAFGHPVYKRPVKEVIAEIEALHSRHVLFPDVNLIADRAYAIELFSAMIPLKVMWLGLVTSAVGIDDELIDYDTKTDLVCITVETYTAKRSYRIAECFRERGIPVVMGGYHATICPEETENYCDSVIVGNAETVWLQMLGDAKNRRLQKRYIGGVGTYSVRPDKSIFTDKKYLPVSLVETGRGCNHNCEFCSISRFYDSHYHARSHDIIEADIIASKYKYFFLVDDNLVANRRNALELFRRIEPLKIKWAGQGTLSMAKDPELLRAMKKSGCEIILIGFESLDKANLLIISDYDKIIDSNISQRRVAP